MPNSVGVYGIPDVRDAGDEVSSTYEGRHLTMLEGELIHEDHTDGFVNKGDPVVLTLYNTYGTPGKAVGVAFTSAAAITDEIAVDTEGIWALTVYGENDAGDSRVTAGDPLYIDFATDQAIAVGVGYGAISKISNPTTNVLFGYALGDIAAGGSGVIAVKVHWNPSVDNAKRTYYTVTSGAYTYGKHHTAIFAGGESTGLEYFNQQVTGEMTGEIYGWSSWMELAAGFTAITNRVLAAGEFGIYDASSDLTAAFVALLQLQGQFAANPLDLYLFRVNITDVGGPIDSFFAMANPGSAGYTADITEDAAKLGAVPFMTLQGVVHWVRTFADAS